MSGTVIYISIFIFIALNLVAASLIKSSDIDKRTSINRLIAFEIGFSFFIAVFTLLANISNQQQTDRIETSVDLNKQLSDEIKKLQILNNQISAIIEFKIDTGNRLINETNILANNISQISKNAEDISEKLASYTNKQFTNVQKRNLAEIRAAIIRYKALKSNFYPLLSRLHNLKYKINNNEYIDALKKDILAEIDEILQNSFVSENETVYSTWFSTREYINRFLEFYSIKNGEIYEYDEIKFTMSDYLKLNRLEETKKSIEENMDFIDQIVREKLKELNNNLK